MPNQRTLSPVRQPCLVFLPVVWLFLACSWAGAGGLAAQHNEEQVVDETAEGPTPKDSAALFTEQEVELRDSVEIAGVKIDYTVKVGDLILHSQEEGEPQRQTARMTYVSYLRAGVAEPSSRPVTFAFNGGPGSASVWVHLGAFGPKKAELSDEGWPTGPPPGRLVDNQFSILDATDLVFIDPVSTGFSRAAEGEDPSQFHGYSNDIESVAEFIRLWLSRNDRWASPKFIAGESYGTTRSAGLAGYLQDQHGLYLNGVVLVSSVINWQTKVFNVGNDLPYPLILPTYTASAWYHGKLPERYDGDLTRALREAEKFASGDYASALMKGDRLESSERRAIAERLAELSGLSVEYVESADLRVDIYRFAKQLLRDEGKTIGRLDSRYVGIDRDSAGERFEYDPAGAIFDSHFVSLLNDYLRREIGYESDLVFRHSAGSAVRPWDYHETGRTEGYGTNAYANYAETLRAAMHKNPQLQVLVTSGYYDMATPYYASDYTVDHMQLDESVRDNIRVTYYEAGHMMYVRKKDQEKLRRDLLEFMERALTAQYPPAP